MFRRKKDNDTKYHSKKVIYNGIKFDSIAENDRYIVLKLMEDSKLISNLQLQVPFKLCPPVYFNRVSKQYSLEKTGKMNQWVTARLEKKYIADFTYFDDKGLFIVEDNKGYKTVKYKSDKVKMKLIHNIQIFESPKPIKEKTNVKKRKSKKII